MIRVDIRLDHQQRLKGFSVSGHSGTAKRGEDLVCAAASFLFRTAARALELEPDSSEAEELLEKLRDGPS